MRSQKPIVDSSVVEQAILKCLTISTGLQLRRGGDSTQGTINTYLPKGQSAGASQIQRAICELLRRGLIWLDFSQPDPVYWSMYLTDRGERAASDAVASPDNPQGYISRLLREAPTTSRTILFYVQEALKAYEAEAYAASTVMVGVATEQCFYEVAAEFAMWLKGTSQKNFKDILENPKTFYVYKFQEFQKRLWVEKVNLPAELADNLETQVHAAMDLIRQHRNDSGHPSGKIVSQDSCFTNLEVFMRLHKRLYDLKGFFSKREIS